MKNQRSVTIKRQMKMSSVRCMGNITPQRKS